MTLRAIDALHEKDLQRLRQQILDGSKDPMIVVRGEGVTLCNEPARAMLRLPTVEIEIRDPGGAPVEEGTDGEIHIRGPNVMLEYWRRPSDTRSTILPGRWLRTGDIGRLEGGYLVINSRARELILRGSENIYPAEIENRLLAHPHIAEAAVIGVDHEELGQEVKGIVVPRPNAELSPEDLARWVGQGLAYYKVPTHWELRTEPLPRNAVGKVMKHLLDRKEDNPFSED